MESSRASAAASSQRGGETVATMDKDLIMTDLRAFLLLCTCGLLLVLTASVSADVVGLVTEKKTDPGVPEGLSVCNVYVQVDDPADKLLSAGSSQISTDDPLGFWQHELGSDIAPLQALIDQVDATLAFDSFVTIGLKAAPEGGGANSTDPDWNTCAFNCLEAPPCDPGPEAEPGVCGEAVGGWFNSNPTNTQGDPDGDLRVLIAQFTVNQGSTVTGLVTVWINTGFCPCADGLAADPETGLCDDGLPPPTETCDEYVDLPFTCVACESAADCNDDNDCTIDACQAGQCSNTPQPPGTACEADGDLCTVDQCDGGGSCATVGNVDCADPIDECDGGEQCDPGTGFCELLPDAADGTPCSGNGVSDCSDADTCLGGTCDDNDLIAGAGCSADGNECTDDVCNGLGACTHPNATDGTPCTGNGVGECSEADTCLAGTCEDNDQPLDTECDLDGDQCTLDFCDGAGLCIFDSEVSCPKGEVCIAGQCVAGCGVCPTDVTGDGNTGAADLASLLACWGAVVAGCQCFDANGDGIIGPADLATLLAAWGPCPP